ncbi:MAG: hypothetical protein KF859_06480 [Phycisphaeraceae bacterium]|nr:hypothetical protein [Phycisphaeraceae bacterium]
MRLLAFVASILLAAAPAVAQSLTTLFTFQGRLTDADAPASGLYDIRITPYSVASGGSPIGPPVCADDVPVGEGLFTLQLPTQLLTPGDGALYLAIEVRADAGASTPCGNPSGFTALSPRQAVTPAPSAVFAFAVPSSSPARPGAIRFNASTSTFEGYTGLGWAPFQMGAILSPANTQIYSVPGVYSFVVPAGVTWLNADVWGAGGGGGSFAGGGTTATGCPLPNPHKGGGGGGGGGAYARVGIPVTPGETLTIFVGQGGLGGPTGSNGLPGGLSRIRRGATDLVECNGGGQGFAGTTHSPVTLPTLSGFSGQGAALPTIHGSVSGNSLQGGGNGGVGFSAACSGFPANFIAAQAGIGGAGRVGGAPLTVVTLGGGGRGGTPINALPAENGQHGMVRLFWN